MCFFVPDQSNTSLPEVKQLNSFGVGTKIWFLPQEEQYLLHSLIHLKTIHFYKEFYSKKY